MAPNRSSTHFFRLRAGDAGPTQRSALLERLLAQADSCAASKDWRADAFRVLAPESKFTPAAAAVALCAAHGAQRGASVFLATPVHYLAEMSNVRLPEEGIVALTPTEADLLAVDFNRLWRDAGLRMLVGEDGLLLCLSERLLAAATHDPEDVRGRHIHEFFPTGADARPLRALMSELELWLFDHAVNRDRAARGELAVNGLWLWGGGAPLSELPAIGGWSAGRDPMFGAWNPQTHFPLQDAARSAVVVLAATPGAPPWRDAESEWLAPSLRLLHSRHISQVVLSAAARCFTVRRGSRWRFWRRARPWWESFA
jgi:hypothetical protein